MRRSCLSQAVLVALPSLWLVLCLGNLQVERPVPNTDTLRLWTNDVHYNWTSSKHIRVNNQELNTTTAKLYKMTGTSSTIFQKPPTDTSSSSGSPTTPSHSTALSQPLHSSDVRSLATKVHNVSKERPHHPTIPANSTLMCEPPKAICSKRGQTLEQHCRIVGMAGAGEWRDPDDGCNRRVYWDITTADTHGIILEVDFVNQLPYDYIYIWNQTKFGWDELRLKSVPDAYGSPVNTLLIFVLNFESRKLSPGLARISVRYTSHPLKHMPLLANVDRFGVRQYLCDQRMIPEQWKCDTVHQCLQLSDEFDNCAYMAKFCGLEWFPYEDVCFKVKTVDDSCPVCSAMQAEPALLITREQRAVVARHARRLGATAITRISAGLRKVRPVSPKHAILYRNLLQWGGKGGPIAYDKVLFAYARQYADCYSFSIYDGDYKLWPCNDETGGQLSVCMKEQHLKKSTTPEFSEVHLPQAFSRPRLIATKVCSDGSLVHKFHPCPHTDRTDVKVWSEQNLPLFGCTSGTDHVHYTLVCDGNPDCQDGSDENNCNKADLSPISDRVFVCVSFQIIENMAVECDGQQDCLDGSDEYRDCLKLGGFDPKSDWRKDLKHTPKPPATVELTGDGEAIITKLSPLEGCKETHFQCPGGYCIPTYLINNGEKDCLGGEDENIRKESFTCPGFYRCLESESCVHPKYVCDGVPHCLNHDDERYCDLVCPHSCSCEGYAFTCRQIFDYKRFFQVRYLDLSGSWRPSLENIHLAPLLLYLNLSRCGLSTVNLKGMPLLNVLDLSNNDIHNINGIQLENLTGLAYLDLSENPMTSKYVGTKLSSEHGGPTFTGNLETQSGTSHFLPSLLSLNLSRCALMNLSLENLLLLSVLDLSFNQFHNLKALQFKNLPGLTHLNMSGNPMLPRLDSDFVMFTKQAGLAALQTLLMVGTGIVRLDAEAFGVMQKLTSLDLRKNTLRYLSEDSFKGLNNLRVLRADDARVCCAYFHQGSVVEECDVPGDELSSCEDLLRTNFFRVFLWILSMLAVVTNAGILIFRLLKGRDRTFLAYHTLLVNLNMSDFLMGVYLAIIGSADAQFRGVYVAEETSWRESNTCKAAGFLSFVSSEVSALTIFLITLDRLFVIKFPYSTKIRLTKLNVYGACVATWIIGTIQAAIPLFWNEFYQQNGICLPLPIKIRPFPGQHYGFGVFTVFNVFLFFVIGVFQTIIVYLVHNTAMTTMIGHRQQDSAIARRLLLIVCTDFCCWFPIGLMGLLASSGVSIPGVVNVWAAVFVMPINSALNPFLYTINALLDRRAKKMEQQRIEKMMSKLRVELRSWSSDQVKQLLHFCLTMKLVQRERILQLNPPSPDLNDPTTRVARSVVKNVPSSPDGPVNDLHHPCNVLQQERAEV